MDFKGQQERLDNMKWYDSIAADEDKCGSYVFCCKCRKYEPYPCAKALNRYRNGYIRLAVIRCRR